MMLPPRQPTVKCTGPPDAGNPHVRWDEGGDAQLAHGMRLFSHEGEIWTRTKSKPTGRLRPRYSTVFGAPGKAWTIS